MFFRNLLIVALLTIFTNVSFSQITESFESGWSDNTYGAVSNGTTPSGNWESNNALINTDKPRTGTKYIRFNDDSGNNEYLEYQGTDGNGKDNGLGTISFWYRHWDADGSSVQFQVQYNQSGGGWTNIGGVINVTSTTYSQFSQTINILGDDILIRVISISDAERLCLDDFEMNDYTAACTPDSEPSSNASVITFPNTNCSEIELNWTDGNGTNRIVVASAAAITGTPTDQTNYSPSATFGLGNTIAANEYVVYNGSGSSVTVTGLSASTTYHFKIFEYNGNNPNCDENYLTSGVTGVSEATVACSGAEITGILVDACGGNEGIDELFTFTNGNADLNIDDIQSDFPNGESYCNSGCGARTWTTNATYVAQLNTDAGCPGLFVEADPIPADANVVVFTGATPSYAFDFSGLCGTGPFYAIFANNTNTGGRFGNYNGDCSQYRTLTVSFGGGSSDAVTYQRCALSNTDGDYVSFTADGTASYSNDGCTPTGLLPIELLSFEGTKTKSGNLLEWNTLSETNNDFFTIEKSNDAKNFIELGSISGAGNSNTILAYSFLDDDLKGNVSYYRLKQTDYDGKYSYSNIIFISNQLSDNIYFNNSSNQLIFKETIQGEIKIFNTQGQLLISNWLNQDKFKIELPAGIYVTTIFTEAGFITKKIMITQL